MKRCLAVAVLITLSEAGRIQAQSPDSSSFEVVSIKPAEPGGRGGLIRFAPGGRFEANAVPVKLLMQVAYDLQSFQIVGLPPWADSDRFIVDAKAADAKIPNAAPGNPSIMTDDERRVAEAKLHSRLQALLADRFNMKAHRETREMPVYALVVAKGGSKLKPANERRGLMGGRGQLTGTGASLDMLVRLLSNTTGRTVIDRTGLNGAYDFKLQWAPDPGQMELSGLPVPGAPPGGQDAPPPDGPSLFTAIQEQLGLRLEASKGPVEVLVVDHVEKPSAN